MGDNAIIEYIVARVKTHRMISEKKHPDETEFMHGFLLEQPDEPVCASYGYLEKALSRARNDIGEAMRYRQQKMKNRTEWHGPVRFESNRRATRERGVTEGRDRRLENDLEDLKLVIMRLRTSLPARTTTKKD